VVAEVDSKNAEATVVAEADTNSTPTQHKEFNSCIRQHTFAEQKKNILYYYMDLNNRPKAGCSFFVFAVL
jgi:hypothetical protein